MRVLFWGTPEFATPSLRALVGEGFDVIGVVTQPDKPRGRSRSRTEPSAVKRAAVAEEVPVLQPERPRGEEFMRQLRGLQPDISVVVAYGHILPRAVIDIPRLGTVNVHASLLPSLRGAAPIQAAIRGGLDTTGVTIMQMVPALDAGPILLQMKTPISDDQTYGDLALRLSELGALALIEALTLISLGATTPQPQDEARATYAPKLSREDHRIDWSATAQGVSRAIRASDPVPGAYTSFRGGTLKLFAARVADVTGAAPGQIVASGENLVIGCRNGTVGVSEVQAAGKRRMAATAWLRGNPVTAGEFLGE